MIRIVRRLHLLAVLALLLSGLLQPLAAAQGMTCALPHAPGGAQEQAHDESHTHGAAQPSSIGEAHDHSTIPQSDAPHSPTAPCGVAVLPARPVPPLHFRSVHSILPQDELPLVSSLLRSLFRPPRLS